MAKAKKEETAAKELKDLDANGIEYVPCKAKDENAHFDKEKAEFNTVLKHVLEASAPERLASNLQLHAGLDALGASLTVSLKKNASKIVMEANGALVTGKKSDGRVFIPYANIRGAVLI